MRITTDRLTIREYSPDDVPAVLAYQRDPRYLQYYAWPDRSQDDVKAFLKTFIDWQEEEPRHRFQLAITLTETGELIGGCGVRRIPDNDWEAEIGYELTHEQWGNGYATEASRALLAFGFQKLGLHRISAGCVADNAASVAVLERLGMTLEARLREHTRFKDRWWDALLYGLLEDEWRANAATP